MADTAEMDRSLAPTPPSPEKLTYDQVCNALGQALDRLHARDHHLLAARSSERSLTHRLAVYLEQLLPGWDVDCEYNRVGCNAKKVLRSSATRQEVRETVPTNSLDAVTVFPDIIVHKRNTDRNEVVIEAKKDNASPKEVARDQRKLDAFRSDLRYRYAVSVTFGTDGTQSSFEIDGDGECASRPTPAARVEAAGRPRRRHQPRPDSGEEGPARG